MGFPTFDKLMDFISYMNKLGYSGKTISKGSLRYKLIKYMRVTTDAVIENYINKLQEMGYIKKIKDSYKFVSEGENLNDFE